MCFNEESARRARLLALRHEVALARADVTLILDASMSAVKKRHGRIFDKRGVDNRKAAADAVRRRRAR